MEGKKKENMRLSTAFIILMFGMGCGKSYKRIEIKPSETDKRIIKGDGPHLVMYDMNIKQGKLMVYLDGTGGIAAEGPEDYFNTVVGQGYRLISLSYLNEPSVAEICNGATLAADSTCAEEFHRKRIFGEGNFNIITDGPQDGIVTRLVHLLRYLEVHDSAGNWGYYLKDKDTVLRWKEIAFSGQSQGGGMAEYIGKHKSVYKIISFSGGWDWAVDGGIASWYTRGVNATGVDSWYGTYNTKELGWEVLQKEYRALGIPEGHIYGFNKEVNGDNTAHTDGILNSAYKEKWVEMLGRGN